MNLLQRIKGSTTASGPFGPRCDVAFRPMRNAHVVGAYVFRKEDFKANQLLFNDGLPSIIFMPQRSDVGYLNKKGRPVTVGCAWVCYGVIKETYWEIPEGLDHVLVLRFKPSAFFSLFNVEPAFFQGNPVCNLEDIMGVHSSGVIDQLYLQTTLSGKLRFLDEMLLTRRVTGYFPPMLDMVLNYIEEKKGNTTVTEIDQMLGRGVNAKWLHRNFVRYLGIAPKKYISLQRFIYTYGMYQQNRSGNTSTSMSFLGYYDYNHFVKDFKRYIGITPSQYLWD